MSMKTNKLIIDGVDYISTFYHQVKENGDIYMHILHDVYGDDEWSEVVEFGYTKIAVEDIGYFTGWIEYDKVKAVKIRVYSEEIEDYREYFTKYINKEI